MIMNLLKYRDSIIYYSNLIRLNHASSIFIFREICNIKKTIYQSHQALT